MIVMAIEAANQVADSSRFVRGFLIKDVWFHAPLEMTLSSTGVETILSLHSVDKDSGRDFTSLSFRLFSHEGNQWIENSTGTIQIVYQEESNEVEGGKEAVEETRRFQRLDDDTVRSCTKPIDSGQFYQRLREFGYEYGLAFQPLELIHCNEKGMAVGDVTIFQGSPNSNTDHAQPHIIHPTTLDGMMQLVMAALSRGKTKMSTMVPTYIGKLWVSSAGLSHPRNSSVKALVTSIWKGYRIAESQILVFHKTEKTSLIQMNNLEMTIISRPYISSLINSQVKKLCFSMEQKPAVALLDGSQILKYCTKMQKTVAEPVEFFQDLGLLLLMFISMTLQSIAASKTQTLKPHYQKYVDWMGIQLEKFQTECLPNSRSEWKDKLQDVQYYQKLCKRVSTANKQGRLYSIVGQNLVHVLQGGIDPLDLLFRGDLAKEFYQELTDSTNCFHAFSPYLDALAHTNPRMKILEIGAGTGSATGSILKTLTFHGDFEGAPRYDQYDFTDISQSFFENARATFKDHERVVFKVLNIEVEPLAQGFDAGTYDMIVASNVLHATKNLSVTVRHIRKLLKPGGKLVLFEVTEPQILRSGFIFGLLPGWWLATEKYREWSPCISTEMWHETLIQQQFSGTDFVLRDFPSDACHELSLFVSTAVEQPLLRPSLPYVLNMIILIDESQKVQKHLAQQLEAQVRSQGRSNCTILSLHRAASTGNLNEVLCIFLHELEQPLLPDLKPDVFLTLRHVLTHAGGILWVTKGGDASHGSACYGMINGLARVLRTESDGTVFVTLALELNEAPGERHVQNIFKVLECMTSNLNNANYEPAYVERDGMLYVDRITENSPLNHEILMRTQPEQSDTQRFGDGPPLELHVKSPGLLDTLCWIEDANHKLPLAPDEVEVEVKAVGLNFMDCLVALGKLNTSTLGSECSGIVTRVGQHCDFIPGERVCVANLNICRSLVRSGSQNVARIPDELSFVEAAALPTTFITAYHSLHQVARIEKGESILIHSAAGGTGQAATQVAQHFGAEVFITVGSKRKKQLMIDLYAIPEDHIFYSRGVSFAQGVKRMTGNRGVDIVLNSLAGEGLIASWECIAPYGRFLEIGKKDIYSHHKLPMFQFAKNVTFSAIDIASMELERPWLIGKELKTILALVAEKKLRIAQPLHLYKVSDIEQAFQFMQSGQNDGKIVLEINKEDIVAVSQFLIIG